MKLMGGGGGGGGGGGRGRGGKRSQEASVSNWKSQIFQLGRKSYTPLPSSLCWLDQVDWLEVCLASGCRVLSSLGFSRSNLSRFFRDELSGCRRRIVYTASNQLKWELKSRKVDIHGTAAVVNAKASRGNPIFRQEKKKKEIMIIIITPNDFLPQKRKKKKCILLLHIYMDRLFQKQLGWCRKLGHVLIGKSLEWEPKNEKKIDKCIHIYIYIYIFIYVWIHNIIIMIVMEMRGTE